MECVETDLRQILNHVSGCENVEFSKLKDGVVNRCSPCDICGTLSDQISQVFMAQLGATVLSGREGDGASCGRVGVVIEFWSVWRVIFSLSGTVPFAAYHFVRSIPRVEK